MNWKRLGEGLGWVAAILLLPHVPEWIASCHTAICTQYGREAVEVSVLVLAWLRQHKPDWDGIDRRQDGPPPASLPPAA